MMRISLLQSTLIIGAVGMVCAGAIIYAAGSHGSPDVIHAMPIVPPAMVSTMGSSSPQQASSTEGNPVGLIIPAINVDTTVEPAGFTADGAMAVPAGPTSTTWFDLGPRPGDVGSAVIAGHEGWKDGIFAVFNDLHKLQVGDKIYIVNDQGISMTFVVKSSQLYDQNAGAASVFGSSDGKAHLNLITCEGAWNAANKSYSNRLVVFADEVTAL